MQYNKHTPTAQDNIMQTLELTDHDYEQLRLCVISRIEYALTELAPYYAVAELVKVEPLIKRFNITNDDLVYGCDLNEYLTPITQG